MLVNNLMLLNADVIMIALSAVWLCILNMSENIYSTSLKQKVPDFSPFFGPYSIINDFFNGSYQELLHANRGTDLFLVYYYAKWDADSRIMQSTVNALASIIPFKIYAIDCWNPNAPCSEVKKLLYFPALHFHFHESNYIIPYSNHYSIPHIAAFASEILNPIRFAYSADDISELLIIFKVVVLARFDFRYPIGKNGFAKFHEAALSVLSRVGMNGDYNLLSYGKDITFVVTNNENILKENEILFLSKCHKLMNKAYTFNKLSALNLSKFVMTQLQASDIFTRHCYSPLDLTPELHHRQNLFQQVLSTGPLILFVGPGLSLLDASDPELYLLQSFALSYTTCGNHTSINLPAGLRSSSRSRLHLTVAERLLRVKALSLHRHRCRLLYVCPRWFELLRDFLNSSSALFCGFVSETREHLIHPDNDTNITGLVWPYIAARMKTQEKQVEFTNELFRLVQKLQPSELASGGSPPVYKNVADIAPMTEQLHFLCCSWQHKSETGVFNHNSCDTPTLLLHESNRARGHLGLGCRSNRTVRFHTLDSTLQPKYAWEIAGYRAGSHERDDLSVVLIDVKAESVYRLEEAVTYDSLSQFIVDHHLSKLTPWMKTEQPVNQSDLNDKHDSSRIAPVIRSIRSASDLQELLDARSRITLTRNNSEFAHSDTNIILLYYSRSCIFTSHGDTASHHFDIAARYFDNKRSPIDFFRVDVSVVDLPYHLRVERIPYAIFFPANRSSYSSGFSWNLTVNSDSAMELIEFISRCLNPLKRIVLPQEMRHSVDLSLHTSNELLRLFKNAFPQLPLESSVRDLLQSYNSVCRNQSDLFSNAFNTYSCNGSLSSSVTLQLNRLSHAYESVSALLQRTISNLNSLRSSLSLAPFLNSDEQSTMTQSMRIQFDLYYSLLQYKHSASQLIALLTKYTYF